MKSYEDATAAVVLRKEQLAKEADRPVAVVEPQKIDARSEGPEADLSKPEPALAEDDGQGQPTVTSQEPSSSAATPDNEAVSAAAQVGVEPPVDERLAYLEASIPKLAFGVSAIGATAVESAGFTPNDSVRSSTQAGALLNLADGAAASDQIAKADAISDPGLKAAALYRLLTLYSSKMTDGQIGGVLNALHDLDRDVYTQALIVKLPDLLRVGDLERANALRNVLLDGPLANSNSFSMLAYVASCYTMAGLKQDAGAIVHGAVEGGAVLSADDLKLINMAVSVANGSYPAMQEFYDYRSDEVRLSSYITLAMIARQLGLDQLAHRAVGDAVKFVQKSSVKLDRPASVAQILVVAPGAFD